MDQGGDPDRRRHAGPSASSREGGDTEDRILSVLSRYLSETSARAAMTRAEQVHGSRGRALQPVEMGAFFGTVERCAATFLDRKYQSLLHGELQFELGRLMAETSRLTKSGTGDAQSIAVRPGKAGEWDLSVVRARAREHVTALGGSSFDVVKAMTLASELARNIVLYTPGGRIELAPSDKPRGLCVRAIDEGPGIANVELVLSGKYRSKTGLGRGLLGAKQLCYRFEIETNAHGTRIEAELRF
jgi:serine/threonine-protein kinase RsbT